MMLWIIIIAIIGLAMWGVFRWVDHRNSVDVYTPQDEQDHLDRLKPYYRREVVERKVRSLFPDQDHAQILQLLDDTTPEFWGLERMQLSILRLSRGNLDQLHHYLKIANSPGGFIKVMQLAESPNSSRVVDDKELFWGRHKKLIEKDFREYEKWLKQK
jgi:hypothetical protein